MLTTKEFISQYRHYSDEELFQMHNSIDTYAEEAQVAFQIVLEEKGGIATITQQLDEQQKIKQEAERIGKETAELFTEQADPQFLKKLIISPLLSDKEVDTIIEQKVVELKGEQADKKITARTIIGSVIGGSIASIVGGFIWGLQMVQMHRIFTVLFVGLVLLSYGLIKLFTRQSKENKVVLIATVLSVVVALLIGQLVYQIAG